MIKKIYQAFCDNCGDAFDYHESVQYLRGEIRDDPNWHWFSGKLYCSDECNTERKR